MTDNIGQHTVYKVRVPWTSFWTEDYESAYQLATGVHSADGGDDHEDEERITALGPSPRSAECVYCGVEVSESRISEHHVEEHPRERYNPSWYLDEVVSP